MTNTRKHAKRELDILLKTTPDAIIREFVPELLALCQKFGKSGQSGGSAPYTARALSMAVEKLCLQKPICPITGIDTEWEDITEHKRGKKTFQNNRDSRIFKDGKTGQAYFLDAIVFDGDTDGMFTSNGGVSLLNGKNINSAQSIKSFPFTPKTFYVDVLDHRWKDKEETTPDKNGDWWTHTIKSAKQLEKVFKYYDELND